MSRRSEKITSRLLQTSSTSCATLSGEAKGFRSSRQNETRLSDALLFSPSLLDAPKRLLPVQVLSPIGVVPARQNQGVGTALIRRGLELLSERDVPLVFLEGAPGYYSRFGFEPGAAHGFRKPSLRIPDAAFQVLRLPTYESWMTGTLVYAEAFWRHDAVGRRDPKA